MVPWLYRAPGCAARRAVHRRVVWMLYAGRAERQAMRAMRHPTVPRLRLRAQQACRRPRRLQMHRCPGSIRLAKRILIKGHTTLLGD